jgi:cytochrome bd-type quinol oxidase subunit 2
MKDASFPRDLPLWPLPLLAGLLPIVATLIALLLSIRLDLVLACNPFIEGCISVSRAARHGLPNHLFKALVLPAAALQALTWLLCRSWLTEMSGRGTERSRWLRHLAWIGITAAVFLVLYAAFLGTEGRIYRWLRQYGTVVYFGLTCIAMLIASESVVRLAKQNPALTRGRFDLALPALCIAVLMAGLVNTFVAPFFDMKTEDRIENATEWWGATMLMLAFLVLALLWRRTGCSARLVVDSA